MAQRLPQAGLDWESPAGDQALLASAEQNGQLSTERDAAFISRLEKEKHSLRDVY